jgi:hypothetical protein
LEVHLRKNKKNLIEKENKMVWRKHRRQFGKITEIDQHVNPLTRINIRRKKKSEEI